MSDSGEGGLRRRELLRAGAGFALGALGIAGCGVGDDGNPASGRREAERAVRPKVDGDLVYFNWPEYLNPDLIKAFERRYGVRVRESNFDSMTSMAAKLRAGNRYDMIFPTADWADRLRRSNRLMRIDRARLKNAAALYGYFDRPWYDPRGEHTVPYGMYSTGILYRADKIDGMSGSWNDLGIATGRERTYLLDEAQEVIGAGNLATGADLNATDPAVVENATDWVLGLKKNVRAFSTDVLTNMVSGNAWIHHGWNGELVKIRNQVDRPEDYRFQKCREGIPIGNDCFAIPANARHPGTALLFIDFVLEPENVARNVEYFGYPMPYAGAEAAFDALVKHDPEINVTIGDLENGQQFHNLGAEGRRVWDRAWTKIKAA